MGAPVQSEITRLLKRGLNHYGVGDLEAAIASWEEALELDPKNRAALDYVKCAREEAARTPNKKKKSASAGSSRPVARKPVVDPEDRTPRTLDAVVQSVGAPTDDGVVQALALYKEGKLEEAYEALQAVAAREPNRLDVEAYLTMLRGKRAKTFAKEVGDQGRALRVIMSMDRLKKCDLKPDEGYLIAQIDGLTSIEQLLSMSRDRVRALEVIARLLRDRIVE